MTGDHDTESDLPEGWALARLAELAVINPRHRQDLDGSQSVTFVPMAGLSETRSTFDSSEERPLSEVRKGYTHFSEGDVLFAKITPCMENGKAAVARGLTNGLGCGTTELHVVRPMSGLLAEYIYHYLHQESVRSEAAASFSGSAGQLRVPVAFMNGLPIPLPPLAEQRRIVAKVEALLARVQATRDRLARVPTIIKRFRQSILAAACSGQLTADWRCTAIPDGGVLPDGWEDTTIESLCAHIVDCPHSTPKWTDKGVVCLRTTNFLRGRLDLTELRYVSETTYKKRISRLEPTAGDVLYSREGGILGIACMMPEGLRACLGQRMMLMRPGPKLLSSYLMHLLNCPTALQMVREVTGGTASPHLNVGDVKKFMVPLPSVEEQHEIDRRVAALFKLADAIDKRVALATKYSGKLTQAILTKAFRGELVPTEAELARTEGRDYESAEQLLARIRTEIAMDEKQPQPKRKTTMPKKARTPVAPLRPLVDVLRDSGKPMAAEDLMSSAGYSDDSIEEFYQSLRDGVRKGVIRDPRETKNRITLAKAGK